MSSTVREFFDLQSLYFHLLEQSPEVGRVHLHFRPPNAALLAEQALPEALHAFYSLSDDMHIGWEANREQDIVGRIKICKLEHFLGGLKAIDSSVQPEEALYAFHPFDFHSDEACCGLFVRGGQVEDRMYHHVLGETQVTDLGISFEGYLRLAIEARGFRDWPLYLGAYRDPSQGGWRSSASSSTPRSSSSTSDCRALTRRLRRSRARASRGTAGPSAPQGVVGWAHQGVPGTLK